MILPLIVSLAFGLWGMVCLLRNPASESGHVFVSLALLLVIFAFSIAIHEFAHAMVGRWMGLRVLSIWIGRGKTFWRAGILGFRTEFKIIPIGGFTFLTHGFIGHLRLRYFLTILAGPLANAILLAIASRFTTWDSLGDLTSFQFGNLVAFAQVITLTENLVPYRLNTAVGRITTDGLSLWQLSTSRDPDVLSSPPTVRLPGTDTPSTTWTS